MEPKPKNRHDSREAWCAAAKKAIEPHFEKCGYKLPDNIRFAVAFGSRGRKAKLAGECLFPSVSRDRHFEIIVRCDKDQPGEILGILIHELVHVVAGPAHDTNFRDVAASVGLDIRDGLRKAMPGPVLQERVNELVAALGPIPHGAVDLEKLDRGGEDHAEEDVAADKEKKQKARTWKNACSVDGCGYKAWVSKMWIADMGPPHCPAHGAMKPDPRVIAEIEADQAGQVVPPITETQEAE